MKKLIISLILLLVAFEMEAQTRIATSNLFEATANHNQRKIVRDLLDNVYIVYADSTNQGKTIKGLWLNNTTNEWSSIAEITSGTNPSIAINKMGVFNLLFETNDSVKAIAQTSSTDFIHWTTAQTISDAGHSCQMPIADSDSTGKFNAFWIENIALDKQSLIFATIIDNQLSTKKTVTTKPAINDIAIANHLQNFTNDLIFSCQFNGDSLLFFQSKDAIETIDTIYKALGSKPCISFNSTYPDVRFYDENPIRILYLDSASQLTEIEHYESQWDNYTSKKIIESDSIDEICIDDILPPLGYSFLFMKNHTLYHGFSYGADWYGCSFLDTISTNPMNPSLAYKNFSSLFIDFIWMQENNNSYDIYYKRDNKLRYVGKTDYETGKGFSITGYPNPCEDRLYITVEVDNNTDKPLLEIYDSSSRKIKTVQPTDHQSNKYQYCWEADHRIPSGFYFIKCTVGQRTTARKVLVKNE